MLTGNVKFSKCCLQQLYNTAAARCVGCVDGGLQVMVSYTIMLVELTYGAACPITLSWEDG